MDRPLPGPWGVDGPAVCGVGGVRRPRRSVRARRRRPRTCRGCIADADHSSDHDQHTGLRTVPRTVVESGSGAFRHTRVRDPGGPGDPGRGPGAAHSSPADAGVTCGWSDVRCGERRGTWRHGVSDRTDNTRGQLQYSLRDAFGYSQRRGRVDGQARGCGRSGNLVVGNRCWIERRVWHRHSHLWRLQRLIAHPERVANTKPGCRPGSPRRKSGWRPWQDSNLQPAA